MGDAELRLEPVRPLASDTLPAEEAASERQPIRRNRTTRSDSDPSCPGRRGAALPRRAPPPPPPRSAPPPSADPCRPASTAAISVSPLARRGVAAAATARPACARCAARRMLRQLRERAVQELRAFERTRADAGIAMELLRPAHYALCASIDDVVLNTPWGAASGWANQTLVATFHPRRARHGSVLRSAPADAEGTEQIPAGHRADVPLPVARLHGPLPAGARRRRARAGAGRNTRRDRGPAHRPPIRSCRDAGAASPRRISPRRQRRAGLGRLGRQRRQLCGGLLFWTSTSLNAASDGLQAQVLAAPPDHMPQVTRAAIVQPLPPPPPPAEPTALDRLRASLQAGHRPRRRQRCSAPRRRRSSASPTAAMFASGSAAVQPASLPLLERIAAALRNESGIAAGDRLHRQPADPHRAVSLELPALRRARQRRARDHRARCRVTRRGSARKGAPMPIRSLPTPRRGPRAEPADRDRAAPPGLTARCRRALDTLMSRWCISFVGTALLAGLAWFFAPLLPGFEDWPPRLALIVALLLVWGGGNALLDLRRAATRRGTGAGHRRRARRQTEEAQALRTRLTTALDLLKKSLRSRGYLYEQPWYAIIGPPGAGKTTALLNAGLRFPLAEQMGQGAVAGVGGTRLCDWWFTEDAVLIDTAGRYTTQDSNAAVDRAGWDAFLDLLKRDQAAAAAERPARRLPAQRHCPGAGGRTQGACGGDPRPDQGAADAVRRADAGLCAVHQGGPDRRLHRVLRRPRSREARAGLGHDVRPGARRAMIRSPPSPANCAAWWSG